MHLPLPAFGLTLIFSIALCVHVVRTGRELFWLWIILFGLPPIGGIVYFIAVLLPSIMGGPAARNVRQAAQATLDPTRAYRQARDAMADTPTVANRMRLAEAAGDLGAWDEALAQYTAAAQGVHADDPALMEGLAKALVELGRFADALPVLERLGLDGDPGHTPQIGLLFARAYEGLGRPTEADKYFQSAGLRTPGLEGLARYAAFMARTGRGDEARQILVEIDQRLARTNARFQKEGRQWRDLAAEAIARIR